MNISLIGMMGCGKSTIGKLLAEEMNCSYTDTDELIVKRENRTINDIFSTNGEKYFREIESKVLTDVLSSDNCVISTGGGIIIKSENIALLKEKSTVIYLLTSKEVLYSRIKNNTERPLLNNVDMLEKITNLLSEREENYNKAHIVINTDGKEPKAIVKEITNKIWKN